MNNQLLFNIYGSSYTYGWLPEGSRLVAPEKVLKQASERDLYGVEMPTGLLDLRNESQLKHLRSVADELNLYLLLSTEGTQVEHLMCALDAASVLGCKVLRTIVGGAGFGGDRRAYLGRWKIFIEAVLANLKKAAEYGAKKGIAIAVENHQDVTSEELLWFCQSIHSPFFGVTLDTANALGVAELPMEFAECLLPYIKHVHLKDYRIYLSESGYRLARCPVGGGVVPFKDLLKLLYTKGREFTTSLEIGALEARHVRLLEPDFWPEYPSRPAEQLARVMKFVLSHAEPIGSDFRTPHERAASREEILKYEEQEWKESFEYLRNL